MTSAMTAAQAQQAWLNLPPQPPHHYALLGLAPYTADQQAIFQAYHQRAAVVGQHVSGPHAAAAMQLLGQLAAAQACLLNPESRSAYDRTLPQPASASAAAAAAIDSNLQRPAPRGKADETKAPPAASAAPTPYHEVEEPASVLPWLVGGACAGLLAVAVLGVALFGLGRRKPDVDVAQNTEASQRQANKIQRTTDRDRRRASDRTKSTIDDDGVASHSGGVGSGGVLDHGVAPLTTLPERIDGGIVGPPEEGGESTGEVSLDDIHTGETAEPPDATDDPATPDPDEPDEEEAPPETTLVASKLPRSFALPSRGQGGGSGLLAELPVKDAASVKLALDASGVAGGDKFALGEAREGSSPDELVWPIEDTSGGAPRAVGEYSLAGDELSYRWADSAQASDDALASTALAVSFDGREVSINQRSPDPGAPLKLAVDKGAVSTSVKIDSPPPIAKFFLSLGDQAAEFPAHVVEPGEPVSAGHDVDVIFGEATDPYKLALRVSLSDGGPSGIRIEARPMFQNVDEGLKWDYFRPKAVAQTLAARQQQESLLDAQLAQLQQRYGRNPLQLQQAMEIYNRQAAEIQKRVVALEKIYTLCEELNKSGALNYRLFTKVGEREVDLVDSTLGITLPAADAPDEAPPDDAGEIVGPPTAP